MTKDECDLIIAVARAPGRRMMIKDIKKRTDVHAVLLPSLIRKNYMIYFYGEFVAVTDAGYDASLKYAAHNF